MTIANGMGVVHGRSCDLEEEYGITLATVPELALATIPLEIARSAVGRQQLGQGSQTIQ